MTPEGASAASASAAPQKKTSVEEKEVEEKRRISQVRFGSTCGCHQIKLMYKD